jgi:hypothetical protein
MKIHFLPSAKNYLEEIQRLISFENTGRMLISRKLSRQEREIFNLDQAVLRAMPSKETLPYLQYHRAQRFQA